ncbi:hypothetical protein RESH_01919 [Rhodopirellula europaea SH398]|uniref:Uncharacterized protein n=1 Tax=Rhodopirellula europaea SH398 TaxID=1263868 RepID=M5SIH4_9BACT|nr:hypothetical protein RESH_01919 [Rhodopirellula europaea SH398]
MIAYSEGMQGKRRRRAAGRLDSGEDLRHRRLDRSEIRQEFRSFSTTSISLDDFCYWSSLKG